MSSPDKPAGILLTLKGIKPNEIGYNPAVIRSVDGQTAIAVRVEDVNSYWLDATNYDPHIMFFTRQKMSLIPIPDTPIFYQYEDPFAAWITKAGEDPQLLFGAVKVDFEPTVPVVSTYFFKAPGIKKLDEREPVAVIEGMKDIRVCQISNGKLAVFTRPADGPAAPGRIGFTIIDHIGELEQAAKNAPLLKFDIDTHTKMGANEAYDKNGSIHVFCHLATTDSTNCLHYHAYEFNLNPEDPFANSIPLQKVATRQDFPVNTISSKGQVFDDVIFPGGTGGPELNELYVGVEDARIGVLDLSSPTYTNLR